MSPVALIFVLAPYVAGVLVVVFTVLAVVAAVRARRSDGDSTGDRR